MAMILTLVGALALASAPLVLGWRRGADQAGMIRQMGLAESPRRWDGEKFARQVGAGLTFRQLAFGFLAWTAGGLVAGLPLGPVTAFLFALGGGTLYVSGLVERRQTFRLRQAKDILRGLGVFQTLLMSGTARAAALKEASRAIGPDGGLVLGDLVFRLEDADARDHPDAIRAWTLAWDNPAVDILGTVLLASLEGKTEIGPLIASLRPTLSSVIEVLSRARSAAKGIEWQARFLALFPPAVLVANALITPEMGRLYATRPVFVLPVLLGSAISYLLSTRMIRDGLSIEASLGLQQGRFNGVAYALEEQGPAGG